MICSLKNFDNNPTPFSTNFSPSSYRLRNYDKLMRLGLQIQIVDNLDFKPPNFDHPFWSDSNSNKEIVSPVKSLRHEDETSCSHGLANQILRTDLFQVRVHFAKHFNTVKDNISFISMLHKIWVRNWCIQWYKPLNQ